MSDTVERDRRGVERPVVGTHARGLLVRPPARLLAIMTLLVVVSIAWRRGVYYEGGADAVVVAKALLTCLAFALAITTPTSNRNWSALRAAPALWFGGYLAIAAVSGAIAGSETIASLVLVVRLALLATVLILAVAAYSAREVISAMTLAMLIVGGIAVATGLASLAEGRLEGGIPPLSPNAVAMLVTIPLIVITWECLCGAPRLPHLVAGIMLLGLLWATGSRTGFAAFLLAVVLIALTVERVSLPAFATAVLAMPVVLFVAGWTNVLSGFIVRDDGQSMTTLNSRTVAWDSALSYADTLTEQLVGAGLTLRQIPVSAMYRDEQILDSTWVSALLQVGIIGVVLLAVFVVTVLIAACRSARPQRSLYIALVVYLAIVSVLESGMFDASVAFIAFFVVALCARTSPTREEVETS